MSLAAALLFFGQPQLATIDWAALPPLPYRAPPQVSQPMTDFVVREVRQRKCHLPAVTGAHQTLEVDIAVLVQPDNEVRTVVPRAIDCPTVEQYAAGLVTGFARNNLLPRTAVADQWYRASITFTWPR